MKKAGVSNRLAGVILVNKLKQLLFFILLFSGISGFSQTKKTSSIHPFSQKELEWMDSVNAVLGEVFFDSLMKADGRTANSRGPDIFWGFRIIDSTSRYATQFYYTRSKKVLISGNKTIYLLKSGPVFVNGLYNYETKTFSTILRTFTDTLYNSSLTPGFRIIPGIEDSSTRIVILNGPQMGSNLIAGKLSLKNYFPYKLGTENRKLFHFKLDPEFEKGPKLGCGFSQRDVLLSLDSAQQKLFNDTTDYLLLVDGGGLRDTANNFTIGFLKIDSIIAIPASQIETVFAFTSSASSYTFQTTKKERKYFRRFNRKNKAKPCPGDKRYE